MVRGRIAAELVGKGDHGFRDGAAELGAHICGMGPGMFSGTGWVAGGHQGAHEAECGGRGQRLNRGQPAPPGHRADAIVTDFRPFCQCSKRGSIAPADPLALGIYPALELIQTRYI